MNEAHARVDTLTAAPVGLWPLVRVEFRRAFRPPFVAPSVVVVNGLLMTGAWFLLPTSWDDALFRLHGTFVFALVLASWMYADVPATNVLGVDAQASLNALDDPRALGRLLSARNLVLWFLVTPICVLVAVGIGVHEHQWTRTVLTITTIVIPPFGALGIAAWLGVRFPYHPIPLIERFGARKARWHMWGRWLTLVLLPYIIVPWLATLTILPAYALWTLTGKGLDTPLDDLQLAAGALVTLAVSIGMWSYGRRMSQRLVHRHLEYLKAYLADPTRG